jgi:hypothetical protein
MPRILFCFLALTAFFAGNGLCDAAELLTGMNVVVRANPHGERLWESSWDYDGKPNIATTYSGDTNAAVFRIFAEDKLSGYAIRDLSFISLNLAGTDKWLQFDALGNDVKIKRWNEMYVSDTLFRIVKRDGIYNRGHGRGVPRTGSSEAIGFNEPFFLRLGDMDLWLQLEDDILISVATDYEHASTFTFGVPAVAVQSPAIQSPNASPVQTPPAAPMTIPLTQGYSPPPAISCVGGPPKRTYQPCPPCAPGLRQTRSQAECTQALDVQGRDCGAISCETCTCQPN